MVLMQTEVKEAQQTPWPFAHVHLVSGDQGGGKNNTTVARVRDASDNEAVRVYLRDEKGLITRTASVYDNGRIFNIPTVIGYDRHSRLATIKFGTEKKIVRIPDSYKLQSPMRVFSVFHLFGIPYHYISWSDVITLWNDVKLRGTDESPLWFLLDQFEIVGNAREGMGVVPKYLEKKSLQLRKKHIEAYVLVPYERLSDWTMRDVATERIYCSRDGESSTINLRIRRKGLKGVIKRNYDGSEYWRNYLSDDEVPIPDAQVIKALMAVKDISEDDL